MLADDSPSEEFWCPLGDLDRPPADNKIAPGMTSGEWAALSRLALGEWLPDAQIDRLRELDLVERVFGQALLTRRGRATLGVTE